MSISFSSHAFVGNPIRSCTPKPTSQISPNSALESLKLRILNGVPNNFLTQLGSPYFKGKQWKSFHFLSSTTKNLLFIVPKPPFLPTLLNHTKTMSISLSSHAFAGNPIRSRTPKPTSQFSPNSALESLKSRILNGVPNNSLTQLGSPYFKVLPFRKGRPLATSGEDEAAGPRWRLRWMGLDECVTLLGKLSDDRFVYLGWRDTGKDCDGDGAVYWAIDVNEGDGEVIGNEKQKGWCFVELRTLMVATDWEDQSAMGELAIAGHVSVRVDGAILGNS